MAWRRVYRLNKIVINPNFHAFRTAGCHQLFSPKTAIGTLTDHALEEMIQDNRVLKSFWIDRASQQIRLDHDVQPQDSHFYNQESIVRYLGNYKSTCPIVGHWIEVSLKYHQQSGNLEDPNDVIATAENLIHENEEFLNEILSLKEPQLTFQDLFSSVIALSIWSNFLFLASSKEVIVANKPQMLLQEILENLTHLSCKKLVQDSENEAVNETKIGDPWRRLALAKAWLHAQPVADWSTYPAVFLKRCTSEKGTINASRRFFCKFDPETYLDFAKVLSKVWSKPPDFHAYYAIYKFYEFFHYYNINEISVICKAFNRHKIVIQTTHPIISSLHEKSMMKLIEELPQVDDDTFLSITSFNFMSNQPFQPEIITKLLKKVTSGSGTESPIILIRSLAWCLPLKDDNDQLSSSPEVREIIQRIEDFLASKAIRNVSYQEIIFLLHLNSRKFLKFNALPAIKDWLIENEPQHSKIQELPQILLMLAFGDIFDETLIKRMLNDQRLFKLKNDRYSLSPNIIHTHDINRNIMIRKSIAALNGISKHIKGIDHLKLCPKTLQDLKIQDDYVHPNNLKNHYRPEFHSPWETVISQVPELICQRQGLEGSSSKYVAETAIYHFFGITDFIFCLDANGSLVALPEGFMEQDFKFIPEDMKHLRWMTFSSLTAIQRNPDTLDYYFKVTKNLGYQVHFFDYFSHRQKSDAIILHLVNDDIAKLVPLQ